MPLLPLLAYLHWQGTHFKQLNFILWPHGWIRRLYIRMKENIVRCDLNGKINIITHSEWNWPLAQDIKWAFQEYKVSLQAVRESGDNVYWVHHLAAKAWTDRSAQQTKVFHQKGQVAEGEEGQINFTLTPSRTQMHNIHKRLEQCSKIWKSIFLAASWTYSFPMQRN